MLSFIAFLLAVPTVVVSQEAVFFEPFAVDEKLLAAPGSPKIHRTYECPTAFELLGKQCVHIDVLPADLVCPSGTVENGVSGVCATFAPGTPLCGPGLKLTEAGDCLLSETVSPEFVCTEGELAADSAECRVITEVAPYCPNGYFDIDGICAKFTPVEKICPPGFKLSGKECSRVMLFEGSPVCPEAFALDEFGQCVTFVPIPPHCKPGFTLDKNECVAVIEEVFADCPETLTPFEDVCARTLAFEVDLVCPDGFILDGEECVRSIPVASVCPDGTARGSSGQCELLHALIPVCSEFEELIEGDLCQHDRYFVSELDCPAGYTLVHGKCKLIIETPAEPRCAVGVYDEGLCVTVTASTPLIVCPTGFAMVKGPRCVRDVPYDCSETVTTVECDMPPLVAEVEAVAASPSDYKLKAAVAASLPGKVVAEKSFDSKLPTCANVTRVIEKLCTESETVPVDLQCHTGAILQGETCLTRSALPPTYVCSTGHYDREKGRCIKIITLPATVVCTVGELLPDGNCLEVVRRSAEFVCPLGTVARNGICFTAYEEIAFPDEVIIVGPDFICAEGNLAGVVCEVVESIPRATMCPSGSLRRQGLCLVLSEVIYPEPLIIEHPPEFVCPDGFITPDGICRRVEVTPNQYICREGTRDGMRCVQATKHVVPPPTIASVVGTAICPTGFALIDTACVANYVFSAKVGCPADHLLVDGAPEPCMREYARVPICPVGSEIGPNGTCIRRTVSPPRVTEIKICTKGQPGC